MVERSNRKDQIIESAAALFIEQGYKATSMRQIAEAVGCTEAAIYYHYKDGKRALFQDVVECYMPDFHQVLEQADHAKTLPEFLHKLGEGLSTLLLNKNRLERLRWMISEFHMLSDDEQNLFQQKQLSLHDEITKRLLHFVADERQAHHLAWTISCTGFGYMQIFHILGLSQYADFDVQDFIGSLVLLATSDLDRLQSGE